MAKEIEKPDLDHLAWAIEERAEIQRTLLALYRIVRQAGPAGLNDPVNRVTGSVDRGRFLALARRLFG